MKRRLPPKHSGFPRAGYTLLEVTIALLASTFLIVGLASALSIAGAAMDETGSAQVQNIEAAAAMDNLTADLRHATGFTERTATAVTFTVPDRDGDEQDETIRYSWSGTAGDALMVEYNGGTARTVSTGIQQFDLAWLSRSVTGTGYAKGFLGVSYDGFTESTAGGASVTSVEINTPSGTGVGDLLIAVVSVKGDAGSFTMPADWNTLTTQTSSNVSLGIGWKNADASEPASHTVSWSSANYVYGWIMKFSSHDPSNPIHGFDFTIGPSASSQPNAPTILTTVDNTLILRIGGFNGGSITADDTGLQDYQTITMDASGTNVSAGAGYATQANSTSTGTAKFSLTQSQYWIAVTLAIAPSN